MSSRFTVLTLECILRSLQFESSPEDALKAAYLNTGIFGEGDGKFLALFQVVSLEHQLRQMLEGSPEHDEARQKLAHLKEKAIRDTESAIQGEAAGILDRQKANAASFMSHQNPNGDVLVCAACGRKELRTVAGHNRFALSELEIYKYQPDIDEDARTNARINDANDCSLRPGDNTRYGDVFSMHEEPSGERYHLHPEYKNCRKVADIRQHSVSYNNLKP